MYNLAPNNRYTNTTEETYSKELIEKVYQMNYVMLKNKYRDNEIGDDELEEKAIDGTVQILLSANLNCEIKIKTKIDFEFYLFEKISNNIRKGR